MYIGNLHLTINYYYYYIHDLADPSKISNQRWRRMWKKSTKPSIYVWRVFTFISDESLDDNWSWYQICRELPIYWNISCIWANLLALRYTVIFVTQCHRFRFQVGHEKFEDICARLNDRTNLYEIRNLKVEGLKVLIDRN